MPLPGGPRRTLLATLTGRDRPGVTAAVFEALARTDAEVLDVQQLVVRGHLTLALLTSSDGAAAEPGSGGGDGAGDALGALTAAAAALDLDLTTSVSDDGGEGPVGPSGRRVHVTVLG